jgi:hypothetical protein
MYNNIKELCVMTTNFEKLIQDTFGDLETLSPEKVQMLIHEAIQTFTALNRQSQSPDPKQREEAFQTALSLKAAVQAQTEEVGKRMGFNEDELRLLGEKPEIVENSLYQLSSAKEELENLHLQFNHQPKKTPLKTKPHRKKEWIHG